jgi:hypothetical protein
MKEIFKDIQGFEGLYQVSNLGNVKSLNYNHTGKEKILKPAKNNKGYLMVNLYKEGKQKTCKIHRLVAQSFIENPQNLPQVNHKNEIKTDNASSNLEWCTNEYNNNYGTRNQRVAESNTNNPNKSKPVLCVETGKIYSSTNEVQRELGFSQGNISSACRGKYKQAYGYTWKYVN